MEPFDQENPEHMKAPLRRFVSGAQSEHMRARQFVQDFLLKDLANDPDDFMLDCVGFDEWEDFVCMTKQVLSDISWLPVLEAM